MSTYQEQQLPDMLCILHIVYYYLSERIENLSHKFATGISRDMHNTIHRSNFLTICHERRDQQSAICQGARVNALQIDAPT